MKRCALVRRQAAQQNRETLDVAGAQEEGMTQIKRSYCLLALFSLVAPLPALAQGIVTHDIDYLSSAEYEDGKDLLDIYMPEGVADAPVVVFFHGGALRAGDKSDGQGVAQRLVPHGIGVVSASYRLTPSVMHPAHVQDAAAATAWVVENIADYGGNPDNVYVSGHSAGAYLAALLTLDPSHLEVHDLDPSSLRGSIPISAFLYVEETAADRPKDVWGTDPADWLVASVAPHIGTAGGRMLLIYADGDDEWRREQNERFGEAMRSAGSHGVRVVEVPNRNHMSLMTDLNASDDHIGDLMLRFIQQHE
ncbi:MAG: alpha/beta hydrolase [Gemmatimonadales bacterium]|nr:alpha/beta hydrolase [Gemmatimonadales bacterium]MBT4437802.1 alpha/beta hydrolase [Gemmatimonadales bacterium]MBT4912252.1 alpha/beta hydrolase [Gemmatimonadales bacterium]MBT6374863.1 alpha/beta hydrolase [Gemmatimonadales bacterium]MBT6694094.1 alpha/beta hydrolase [Gemmatimonadales bacterium]